MSITEILITYGSVTFLLLALLFVCTAFAEANHKYERGEGLYMVFVIGAIFWPATFPVAVAALCAALILWPVLKGHDALVSHIRRKGEK
mgnify:CR=1 FL=1